MGRLVPVVLCALLAAVSCGESERGSSDHAVTDWDLSASHTIEDVDWPKPDLSATEISPTGNLSAVVFDPQENRRSLRLVENDMLPRYPPTFPVPVAYERIAAGLVAAVMLAGCGGDGDGGRPAINWNLSTSHTTADVDWPVPGQSAVQIEEPASVRIRFAGGKPFSGASGIGAVGLERRSDRVTAVQLDSPPMTPDEAHRLALDWAGSWALPRAPIEDWYRRHRTATPETFASVEAVPDPGTTVGPGGPEPSLKILNSFNDDRPAIVSLRFFW